MSQNVTVTDPGLPTTWPAGFRSPVLNWRVLGLWRPLLAVLGGLLLPALIAAALLAIAGPGGEEIWLRRQILLFLYAVAAAPMIGLAFLPLLWPLVLLLAVRGWAGAVTAVLAALLIGLPLVHWLLNADVTSEAPAMVPIIALALMVQGLTTWALLWTFAGGARR